MNMKTPKIMFYVLMLFLLVMAFPTAIVKVVDKEPVGEIPFAIAEDSRIYGTSFAKFYPKKPFLQGAYISCSYSF